MAKKKTIHILISLVALLFTLAYIFDLISGKVAFPVIFAILGLQQLIYGLIIIGKENRNLRIFSVIAGVFFLIFDFFIVMPKYYF